MKKSLMINDADHRPIYEIVFEKDFESLAEKIKEIGLEGRKVCIVMDSNTSRLYGETVHRALESVASKVILFQFPAGEKNKTLNVVHDIYKELIEAQFDRKDYLAALGGGVVGDITGFAAATYLRGISFIQLPTTLLSQSDSSVGGKTGVDFDGYKNMVGAFCMPKLVYMNVSTLKTMDERDYLSGMGEVVKHGLIRDSEFFSWLGEHHAEICRQDKDTLAQMDYKNCTIKGDIVEEDPMEKGIRSLLNFGHTLGHAIEKQKAGELYHGECVSIGSAAAAYISMKRGYISNSELEEILDAFKLFKLPVKVKGVDIEEALSATKNDKKMQKNQIRFILLKGIGCAITDDTVTMEEMRAALEFVCI